MVEERRREDSTVVKLTEDVSKIQQQILDKLLLDIGTLQAQDQKIAQQVQVLAIVAARVDENTAEIVKTYAAIRGAKIVLLWVASVVGAIATIVGGWYAMTHLGQTIPPEVLPALIDIPR